MSRPINRAASRLRGEAGLSSLEALGLAAFVISLLAMIPFVREFAVNAIGIVFNQIDEDTGHINDFSVAMRGFAVAAGAVLLFIGSLWLVLWTDVGRRLSFLLTGAAVFGWLAINGILFVVYAPRGIRPENLEGLNAFQMRLPSIALTLGSFVILTMFLVALTRYEADTAD
jgi:hypothetical protein